MGYIENKAKRHKEHFSRDAIVAHLTKVESDLMFNNGVMQSDIDELRHENKELKKQLKRATQASKSLLEEIKKERLYDQLKKQCKELISKCKRLTSENDRLKFESIKN